MQTSPYFQRSPRVRVDIPTGKVVVHDPPNMPEEPKFSIESMLLPGIMTVLTIVLYFFVMKNMRSSSSFLPFMMISSIPVLGTYIFTILAFFRKKKEHRLMLEQLQNNYLEQLQKHRMELENLKVEQAKYLIIKNPSPLKSIGRIENRESNLWERTPEGEDFLDIRIGTGIRSFLIDLKVPEKRGYDDNLLITEAQNIAKDFKYITNGHISISLKKHDVIGVVGNKDDISNFIRITTTQIMTHHAPNEVKIAAFYHQKNKENWNWMRWLPHVWDEQHNIRFLADTEDTAQKLAESLFIPLNMRRIFNSSHQKDVNVPLVPMYIFFLEARDFLEEDPLLPMLLKEGQSVGASTFVFAQRKDQLPMECDLIINVNEDEGEVFETFSSTSEGEEKTYTQFKVDKLSYKTCEQGARSLASIRLKSSTAANIPKLLTFLDLFNVKTMEELEILNRWEENRYPTALPVPIGVREGGKPVVLNIHDKIEKKGHGPHGLMAGTTGSGKSEVIQSIIASLAVTYHPHEMAFMLIDYKGGGMSNTFAGLPHVVASITNLEDPNLIERARISLKAELERRQKLFIQAGNVQHLDEYYETNWREKEPLPHLFIVIDEFAQMKKEQPEFMDELISVAAIGRTLGVHLLLATQKPSGVVNDKIWSNSRFRICLRVQDDGDSREMIKIPDASKINVPGRGYLQVGNNEILELFQSAWSGAPYNPEEEKVVQHVDFTKIKLNGERIKSKKRLKPLTNGPKQLQALIDYIHLKAEQENINPLPGPWLPPLPETLLLDRFYSITDWNKSQWEMGEHEKYQPIVGLIDDVANQAQYPLKLNLLEGHMNVYGMPGTGKTTFIQTVIMSLALSHSPEEVNFYIVDFSRMFLDFAKLPHVGGVVQEGESEKIKRLFGFIKKELLHRKEQFATLGAKSFETYKRLSGEVLPAMVIIIDGYARFKNEHEKENDLLEQLLREAATYGLYFHIMLNQTSDMFDRYRNNISLTVSFELQDASEYQFLVGKSSFPLTDVPPGRGLVKGQPPELFQAALPFVGESEFEYTAQLKKIMEKMRDAWTGTDVKPIPMVPQVVSLCKMLEDEDGQGACIGIETNEIEPHRIVLEEMNNIVIAGRMESGKTSLLQSILLSMANHYSSEQLEIYTVDLTGKSMGIATMNNIPHVKQSVIDGQQFTKMLEEFLERVNERKDMVPQLGEVISDSPNNSRIVIMIDDLEQVLSYVSMEFQTKGMLEKLVEQARNKGVHFIVAGTTSNLNSYGHEQWFSHIRKRSVGYLLGTTDNSELYFFNARLHHTEMDQELAAGEGYFIKRKPVKVKIAYEPLNVVAEMMKSLQHTIIQ
ncbi:MULTISPECIES: type VII secretion protein EssC [Bacillus]|uniref:type VII secretion protein EssC n=1 Tax=Bacillus TaxID=1386 RepID=UPI0011454B0B|nr:MULTISPECIES: type VII secretion protein EssC [Bacillus]